MARTDEPIKKLFKNKENFADLFNATIFQGEQVIKADKLIEISTEDIHIDNVSLEKENISDNIQEETEELNAYKSCLGYNGFCFWRNLCSALQQLY